MPKDFDKERAERHEERLRRMGDRTFVLSGQTFTYRANASYTVLEAISATDELEGFQLIRALEDAIVTILEDGEEERFLAVVRDREDSYTFTDLNDIATWLVEEQVRRPTLAPYSSTDGGASESTSTPSKESSSSELAVESTV